MKTIMHNSVSLDGSFINFDVDMGLHYQIASRLQPDAHLIGSDTVTAVLSYTMEEYHRRRRQT